MIYLFTYGGFDCPLYLEETYQTRKDFLEEYEKMDNHTKENIIHIIDGKELMVKPKETKIVKSWCLDEKL